MITEPQSPSAAPPPPAARAVTIADLVPDGELPPRPRVGRPKGSGKKKLVPPSQDSALPDPEAHEQTPTETAASDDQVNVMAATVFGGVTGALAMSLGEEWLPQNPAERKAMEGGIADYIKQSKWKDIPPRTALLLLCMFYAAPRFKPGTKTHERVKLGVQWIKTKIAERRSAQPPKLEPEK